MLKQVRNKYKAAACEISKSDYKHLKHLPSYLFWEEPSLLSVPPKENKNMISYIFGISCKFNCNETKVILDDGKEIKMNKSALFLGWLDAIINPKINW